MTVDQESLGFAEQGAKTAGAGGASLHPLRQAASRIADFRDGRSLLKAKDLVGLLLCHGARAWRASQPVARSRVRATSPAGHLAIRMRFG